MRDQAFSQTASSISSKRLNPPVTADCLAICPHSGVDMSAARWLANETLATLAAFMVTLILRGCAYARKAKVELPSLGEYSRARWRQWRVPMHPDREFRTGMRPARAKCCQAADGDSNGIGS